MMELSVLHSAVEDGVGLKFNDVTRFFFGQN